MKDLQITPCRTVVTSFNPKTTAASELQSSVEDYFEEGDWVLCVASSPQQQQQGGWVSCALSNGEIQVYDQGRLHHLQTYKQQHASQSSRHHVTDIVCDYSNPNTLAASAADGTVTLFDIRQQHPACQMKLPRQDEEALSLSLGFDGKIAAVGSSKGKIHFMDVRGGGGGDSSSSSSVLLGTYNQAHTKEVTRVRFQTIPMSFGSSAATTTSILVSGAEDGLACVFDTSQASEEAALKNILTVQSPIREVGFFGPQSEAIYCLTGSEGLQLYHKDETTCRKDFGPHLRHYLSQQMGGGATAGNAIDYLVDCHWDAPRQELLLLAGSANGDAGVFRVGEQGDVSVAHHLHGGHRGVLRAWNPLSTNVFVTVGEDARMCEWNRLGRQINSLQRKVAPTEIIVPKHTSNRNNSNSSGPAMVRAGGGKLSRPRSRMTTASPY